MKAPDEVLAAMAREAGYAEFIMCDVATCGGMCEAPEVHFAPAIKRALAAAEALGWVLVPKVATETMAHEGLYAKLLSPGPRYHADNGAIWAAMLAAAPKVPS